MMNLFGKKKDTPTAPQPTNTPQVPDTKDAIGKVRETIDTLGKRETHLERKIQTEVENAKKFSAAGKKREALTCIKRKKMYEKQMEQLGNAKITLEQQQMTLESMNINREILQANKAAAASMQQATKQMGGVDAVDETMDAVEDGLNDAAEIAEAMGREVQMPGMDADEDDLLAELEGLEEEALAGELADVKVDNGPGVAMPNVPVSFPDAGTTVPAAGKAAAKEMTDEEKELAELEASMAM